MPRGGGEPGGRRRLRDLAWQPFALVAAIALSGTTAYLSCSRYGTTEEQKELGRYARSVFPELHALTRSVQAGIVGLVDDTAPSAEEAVRRIDEEILPSIELLWERARRITMDTVDGQALHLAYLQAIEGMREDVRAIRAIFADPALGLGDKRHRAAAAIERTRERFESFYRRAAQLYAENGIEVEAKASP